MPRGAPQGGEGRVQTEGGRTWAMCLYQGLWVEGSGVPRLWLDWSVQTTTMGSGKPHGALI